MLRDGDTHAGARDKTTEEEQNAPLDPLRRRPGQRCLLARFEERASFGVKQQNRPFRGAFVEVKANGQGPHVFTFRLT